jgi:hypothetical protein
VLRWQARLALLLATLLGSPALTRPALAAVTPGGPAGVASELTEANLTPAQRAFVDTLERRTFQFFWDLADSATGLMPDRWPSRTFISIGATGFALTAYPIGAERRYVTREQAAARTLHTLNFLWQSRQDTARVGATGYKGFFYHFVNFGTGTRFKDVELSNIDSALLFAGALFCQSYFDGGGKTERSIRALTDSLVLRADWAWFKVRPPRLSLGWSPEEGFLPYDWGGYNETMILFLLALDSPRHGVTAETYKGFTSSYKWGHFQGQEYLGFAPLFGHQYTHVWVDYRHIADDFMRGKGIDYFENARRATYAQRAYAIQNPSGFRDYGADIWGLTACDGPWDGKLTLDGREREFHSYEARGASHDRISDDGTIAPAAAGGSMPFAPEICLPALMAMKERYGDHVFRKYGFIDAFNPTLEGLPSGRGNPDVRLPAGDVVPGVGWFDDDYLGIDQGPILAMLENWRTGLVWKHTRNNIHIRRGLQNAGFTGGWLEYWRNRHAGMR